MARMRAVVTDFGLAGETSDFAQELGTPRYMAPELWRGDAATKASDVYALGVVLYEMATGIGPGTHPAPPSACVPGLDSRWDRAVMACLSPVAADRPEASEVLSRIEKKPRSKAPLVAAGIVACSRGHRRDDPRRTRGRDAAPVPAQRPPGDSALGCGAGRRRDRRRRAPGGNGAHPAIAGREFDSSW